MFIIRSRFPCPVHIHLIATHPRRGRCVTVDCAQQRSVLIPDLKKIKPRNIQLIEVQPYLICSGITDDVCIPIRGPFVTRRRINPLMFIDDGNVDDTFSVFAVRVALIGAHSDPGINIHSITAPHSVIDTDLGSIVNQPHLRNKILRGQHTHRAVCIIIVIRVPPHIVFRINTHYDRMIPGPGMLHSGNTHRFTDSKRLVLDFCYIACMKINYETQILSPGISNVCCIPHHWNPAGLVGTGNLGTTPIIYHNPAINITAKIGDINVDTFRTIVSLIYPFHTTTATLQFTEPTQIFILIENMCVEIISLHNSLILNHSADHDRIGVIYRIASNIGICTVRRHDLERNVSDR